MSPRIWIALGGVLAALGVCMSAVHAHHLEALLRQQQALDPSEIPTRMREFEAGVRYHLYHAMALVIVGVLAMQAPSPWFHLSGALFFIGTLLFSGGLYVWVLHGLRIPYIAPSGGIAFIAGWVILAIGGIVARAAPRT